MRSTLVAVLLTLVACDRGGYEAIPRLAPDNSELVFTVTAGQTSEAKELVIAEAEGARVPWSAHASRPWLLVSPTSGVTPARVSVRIQPTGLLPGVHSATLAFDMDGEPATGSPPALVAIRVTVSAPGWTALDGPVGGDFLAVTSDGTIDGRALAGDSFGRIWISDDGGLSFEGGARLGTSGIHDLELHATSGRAYAALWNEGVFRSDDGGETWQPTTYIGGARFMAVRTDNPNEVYVVNTDINGVMRSRDGGTTWTDVSPASNAFGVSAGSNPPGQLVVGTWNGRDTRYSSDGGDSWDTWDMPSGARVAAVLVGTIDPQTVIATTETSQTNVSNDGGASWTIASQGVPASWTYDLAEGPSAILAADASGPLVSRDRGATWSGVALPEEPFHPLTHGVAWAGSNVLVTSLHLGVLVGPLAAVSPSAGVYAHPVRELVVHPTSGSMVATTSRAALWRHEGGTWSAAGADLGLSSDDWINSLLMDPADPSRLLAGTCNDGVFESLDFGQTWSPSGTNAGSCVRQLSFAPDDADVVYVAASTGISRSTDRGATFQLLFSGDGLAALALSSSVFAYFTHCSHVYVRDGASDIDLGMNCNTALGRGPSGELWIGHESSIRVWRGGTSAEQVASGTGEEPTAILHDGARLWLAHDGTGLSYSEDDGVSWQASGCPSSRVTGLTVDGTDGSLLVGTADMGVLRFRP